MEQGKKQICTLQLLQEQVKSLAAEVDECLDQHWLQPQQELQQSLSEQGWALREAVRRMLDYERELVHNQSQDQENNNNSLIEAAEAKAVRRVQTEIVINEMTKGHNYTTGKRAWGEKQRIRRAVRNIINVEIQRRHSERAWKAVKSTLAGGYSDDDLAFLECEWLAQINSHQL